LAATGAAFIKEDEMKEYTTEDEFAAGIDELVAEVEEMLRSPVVVDIPVPWWRWLVTF